MSNHLVNVEVILQDLEGDTRGRRVVRLASLAPGASPLFVTRQSNGYYVNGVEVGHFYSICY